VFARPVGYHESGQGMAPPLGLLALAAFAHRRLPRALDIRIHDTGFFARSESRRWLADFAPHVVGVSGVTSAEPAIRELVGMARDSASPAPRVIVGGPHATAYREDCLAIPGVDAVVSGEGEVAFADYLEVVRGVRAGADARGVWFARADGPTAVPPPVPVLDGKDIPFPDYALVDLDRYAAATNPLATIVFPPNRYIALSTTRGCPHRCAFCLRMFGNRFRARPVEDVVDYVAQAATTYGVRRVQIFDDIFNGTRGRIDAFFRQIRARRLDLRFYFSSGLRFDALTRPTLELMREAGVVYQAAAVESASPRILTAIRKRLALDVVLRNIGISDELGIFTTGFFMLGFPGETRADMEETIRFAEAAPLHYAYFSTLNPFRGTEIGDDLARRGVDVSIAGLAKGFSPAGLDLAAISPAEARGVVREAYRRFWTVRRLLAFAAHHPDPESIPLAFVSNPTRANLVRRGLAVLGLQADRGPRDVPWRPPDPLPPFVETACRALGVGGQRVARGVRLLAARRRVGPAS